MKLNTKPLAQIELGFPVIHAGNYHVLIMGDKLEVKPNKAGDGNNLFIMLKVLDNPVTRFKDGESLENKGQIVVTRYISLKPTPDYDPDRALKELAVAIGHPQDEDLELDHLRNKVCMAKISVQPKRKDEATGKEYDESNSVDRFTPIPEDDTFTPPPI